MITPEHAKNTEEGGAGEGIFIRPHTERKQDLLNI